MTESKEKQSKRVKRERKVWVERENTKSIIRK